MSIGFFKNHLFLTPTVMAAAIFLVCALAWRALVPLNEKKGFNRKLITKDIKMLHITNKPEDVLDFSGNTNHHIYFKTKYPSKIYQTDLQLNNGEYININVPNEKGIASIFNCIVDSPYTYVAAPNARIIVKAKPGDSSILYKLPESIYLRVALLSDNSIAARMFRVSKYTSDPKRKGIG